MSTCWYTVQGKLQCIETFASMPPGEHLTNCKGCSYDDAQGVLKDCKCFDKDRNTVANPPFSTKPCTTSKGNISVGFDGMLYCEYPMPEGSYQTACYSCTTDSRQEVLQKCQCFDYTSNLYVNAAPFNIKDCKGGSKDITANNGKLICGYKPPNGEYQETCMNCTMDSNLRYIQNCYCQNNKKDKYYVNPPFDTLTCKGPLASITNVDGVLACSITIPAPAPASSSSLG